MITLHSIFVLRDPSAYDFSIPVKVVRFDAGGQLEIWRELQGTYESAITAQPDVLRNCVRQLDETTAFWHFGRIWQNEESISYVS
jgi:hypothetical protein